jgi:hypothetical protein
MTGSEALYDFAKMLDYQKIFAAELRWDGSAVVIALLEWGARQARMRAKELVIEEEKDGR